MAEENSNSTTIRMIEAFKGEIRHNFSDGLYIHSGDLMDFLEKDRQIFEDATDFAGQEAIENLIMRFQFMIMNRTGGEI